MRALSIGLLCVVLCACSALGLDEFEGVPCKGKHSVCDDLNAELPPGQCRKYYCSASGVGCELRPRDDDNDGVADAKTCASEFPHTELDCDDRPTLGRAAAPKSDEACDGVDNDCDGFIDEGASPNDAAMSQIVVGEGVVQVSYAARSDEVQYLMLTRKVRTSFDNSYVALARGALVDASAPTALFSSPPVCAARDGVGSDQCNFAQLAIAASGDMLIAAAINRSTCDAGQLRVGVGSSDDFDLDLPEGPPESNVAFGVDVDPTSMCTQSGSCLGAGDPLLATLPASGDSSAQALAVWRAPADDDCNADHAAVYALGLFVDDVARRPQLIGTANGSGEALGASIGSAPPALAGFAGDGESGGYFVAYPSQKQLELRFIPRLSDRESAVREQLTGKLAAIGADGIALTLDVGASAEPHGLAVAYRAELSDGPAIVFTQLAFDRERAPHIAAAGDPIVIAAEDSIVAGPSLTYAADGFGSEASGNERGGWLLLWAEAGNGPASQRLMAARIAEAGLHQLGAPIELARVAVSQPFTFTPQGHSLHYGYLTETTLRVGEISCHPEQ